MYFLQAVYRLVLVFNPNRLCFLREVVKLFTFNVIIDMVRFKSILLHYVFCLIRLFFVPFFPLFFFFFFGGGGGACLSM